MDHHKHNGQEDRFDLVALVASAGGHVAIPTLLHDLPPHFDVPIIVMQHLGPDATGTLKVYGRNLPFTMEWATSGISLAPHTVLVCPPRSFVELLPDGTCVVSPCERGALDKPMDRFLESVARSFGERAIGVVLTGMGDDGATGAAQLHLAGGYVLVQSEASADFAEMPKAAIAAGAADLVVPLADLGQVLGEVAAGTPRPKARSEMATIGRVFGETGEVAARAREVDWAATPLGPAISWPEELRLLARTTLESASATAIWWGLELIQIYNDAWRDLLGVRKHPQALGRPARETWAEIWHQIGPMVERVLVRGEAVGGEDYRISVDRGDSVEEVFVTFAYAPIRDTNGVIVGVQTTGWETTRHVVAERRMRALRALATQAAGGSSPREACERAATALASDPADLPFALLYLVDEDRRQATLAGAAGVEAGAAIAPRVMSIAAQDAVWPLARVLGDPSAPEPHGALLDDLAERFGDLDLPVTTPNGARSPHTALLLPLRPAADRPPIGVLVAALSPYRPFDDDTRSFLDLIAQQIHAGIVEARARQLERERAERLAELDRAKTEFFANVSHEFRTPLTLLLAPLEDLLRRQDALPAALIQEVEVATNNARRLLRLVNSLLDFSQIDTRRQQADIKPTDLGELTSDIASAFRSAVEAAGLRLRVECDPNLPPVPVDRGMWDQIVSNLLSNAFKFTFDGEIAVELHALSLHAELVVRDTGIDIPAHELPNLFKRFHRVRGARARTVEGAGIGLAIVDDLVKRLGGQLRVRSTENTGTEFTIWLPYKSFRIPSEPATPAASTETGAFASELARDAARWLADARTLPADVIDDLLAAPSSTGGAQHGKLLVADDNADLRDYLKRLLSPRWDVELAADGESALEAAKRERPDALLADVMMPGLDGFALIQRIREHAELKHTPVILLTARAGEEAAIQGLSAGADDYIAKPFSPRELVARIQAAIERARAERALRESQERLQSLFDTMSQGVAIMELVRNEAGAVVNARYLDLNPAFETLTGFDRSAVAGRQASEVFSQHFLTWQPRLATVEGTAGSERFESYIPETGRWFSFYAAPFGGPDGFVVFFDDITERKQAEERQMFLLKLSDALRRLSDPEEIQATVTRTALEHFNADRCYYCEIEHGSAVIRQDSVRGTLPSIVGAYPIGSQPLFKAVIDAGQPFAVEDTFTTDVLDDLLRQTCIHLQIISFINVPVIKDGQPVGILAITQCAQRAWTTFDVELAAEVAERTWAAVERARAEAALRASEARMRRAISVPKVGVLFFDLAGHMNDANAAFEQMCGYTLEELRSTTHWEQLTAPEFHEETSQRARDLAERGETPPYEKQMIRKDGTRWWGLFAPTRLGGSGAQSECVEFVIDITEHKSAEEALRVSEEKYRTLFDSIDEGFTIVEVVFDANETPVDYRFLELNRAFERHTGIKDAAGRLMREIEPRHEAHWFETYGRIALTGEPARFEAYAEYLNQRWFDVYAFRVEAPELRHVAILFTDITARKQAEAALQRANEELEMRVAQRWKPEDTGYV